MKILLKTVVYILFFVFMLIVFLPKENLYFFALNKLKSQKIEAVHSEFKDTYVGLDIDKINIMYNKVEVSNISKVDFKTYLFTTNFDISDIRIDKSLNKFFPHSINYVNISHSIVDPLKINILSKFAMGECEGFIDLTTMTLKLNIDLSKSFRKKYPMIVRNFKKVESTNKGERYTYEYKFK